MPIDVASGVVSLFFEDISIPGRVDLIWDRTYSGSLRPQEATPFGPGWTNRYQTRLTRHPAGFEFVTPNGSVEFLPDAEGMVERGGTVRHLGAFLEIFMEAGRYVVRSWNVETGHQWRYCFVAAVFGRTMPLHTLENLTGQRLALGYDQTGRLSAIRQEPEQRTLTLEYDRNELLSAVTLRAAEGTRHQLVRYEYNGQGRLAAVFDALGFADRFEYDAEGRLSRHLQKDGGVFFYRYDRGDRCIWYSGLDRYDEKRLRFLDASRTTEVTDSYGAKTIYQHLATGQIVSEANPLGAVMRTEYDAYGRVVAKVEPNGATTRYQYDDRGNRSAFEDALGNTYSLAFDDSHQAVAMQDPSGQVWHRQYDEWHRLAASVDPLGGRWDYQYDSAGNLIALTNPNGDICRLGYESGLRTYVTDWLGQPTTLRYDVLGNVAARSDPLGNVTTYDYDLLGNLRRMMLPDGGEFHLEYDVGRNITRAVDPAGRISSRRYGPCNRLLEAIDPNGNVAAYFWGTEPHRLDRIVNERGEEHRFLYDLAGQCIREVGFDDRTVDFSYDVAGECTRVVNGAHETIEISRDLRGRITREVLSNGAVVRFAYDRLGNVIEAENGDCIVRLERDAMGRLVREHQQTDEGEHWVASGLDRMGETISQETDLGLRVGFSLDANGRLDALRMGEAEMLFRRDARGLETSRLIGDGSILDLHYDSVGRMIEQRLLAGGNGQATAGIDAGRSAPRTLVRRAYTRDLSGLVTSVDDHVSGTSRYSFDPGERLAAVVRDRGPSETFEYDAASNLTHVARHGAAAEEDESLTYGKGNRLLQKGATRYEYDEQGRLTRKIEQADSPGERVWTYTWDPLDQLRSVTRPDGVTWTYFYDAFGRRVRKAAPGRKVDFIYSGRVPVHEVTSENPDWTGWIFKPKEFVPVARVQGDRAQAIIADHLGTPHEMIDREKVSWMHRTMAFGAPAVRNSDGDTGCPFRFQGQYEDAESGLHYNMFRYYDPECGRFISPDPLGVFTDLNLYQYAPNPIGWIDPLGLCRRGNAATQKHMDDVRDQFLADNPGFVLQSGGRDLAGNQVPERLVQAPGVTGVSGGNFPDMTFYNKTTGAVVHVNTVDPRASGPSGMTPREYNNAQNMNTNANATAAAAASATPASGTGTTVVPPAPTVVTVNKGATPTPGSLNTSTMTPGTVNFK